MSQSSAGRDRELYYHWMWMWQDILSINKRWCVALGYFTSKYHWRLHLNLYKSSANWYQNVSARKVIVIVKIVKAIYRAIPGLWRGGDRKDILVRQLKINCIFWPQLACTVWVKFRKNTQNYFFFVFFDFKVCVFSFQFQFQFQFQFSVALCCLLCTHILQKRIEVKHTIYSEWPYNVVHRPFSLDYISYYMDKVV